MNNSTIKTTDYTEFYDIEITEEILTKKDSMKKDILTILNSSLMGTLDALSLLWAVGLEEGCGKCGPDGNSEKDMIYEMAIDELEEENKIECIAGNWRKTDIEPYMMWVWELLEKHKAFFVHFKDIKNHANLSLASWGGEAPNDELG